MVHEVFLHLRDGRKLKYESSWRSSAVRTALSAARELRGGVSISYNGEKLFDAPFISAYLRRSVNDNMLTERTLDIINGVFRGSEIRESIMYWNSQTKARLIDSLSSDVADSLYNDMDYVLQKMKYADTGEYRVDVENQYMVYNTGLRKFLDPTDTKISDGHLSVTVDSIIDDKFPGFTVIQPFSIRYGFEDNHLQISGYVQKGYYNEDSNFVKDEYVEFEIDNTWINGNHVRQYKEGLHALAHSLLHGFPEKLTVNIDGLEQQSLSGLFDSQSFEPHSFDKLELVGVDKIDKLITCINNYDIASKDDVEYELRNAKLSNISDVLDGVRLMAKNKDKVIDYDSKLERVALVLEDYEKELSEAENNEPLDLDNFEIALRVLEQERNMSL